MQALLSVLNQLFQQDSKKRGIAHALLAMLLFSGMAAIAKHFSGDYSAYQIAFFRFFFALIPMTPIILNSGGIAVFRTQRLGGHVWRAVIGLSSLVFYFFSLQHLPLADAVAVSFTNPIFITLLSILLLKEQVGIYRWGAIILGFVGVIVISNPAGASLNIGIAYGLISAILYALAMITLRTLGSTEKVLTTTSYFTLLATLILSVPAALTWKAPGFGDLLLFILCGLLAGFGQLFLTSAYQNCQPSIVAPFNYTSIVWATLIGFVMWGQIPEPHVWLGAVMVVASGILIIRREHIKLKGSLPADPTAP